MSNDLENSIHRVLGDRCSAVDALGVAHSVDLAASALTAKIAQAEANAIDPRSTAEAAAKAKADLDDLSFRAKRLAAARTALAARVDELRRAEEQAERESEQAAALIERDALVAVIRDEIPALTRRYAEIIRELDASDARLSTAGLNFESAEIIARGYQGNGVWADGRGQVDRLRTAKLPLFDKPGMAWADDGMNRRTIWAALEG